MTKNDITGMAEAAAILRSAVREWTDWNDLATRAWFFVVARSYARSLRVVVGMDAALRYEIALEAWEKAMRRHSGLTATYAGRTSSLDDGDRELLERTREAEARAAHTFDAVSDDTIRRLAELADAYPLDLSD